MRGHSQTLVGKACVRLVAALLLWCAVALLPTAGGAQATPLVSWDELAATVAPYDDPFLEMPYEHIVDLRTILRAEEAEKAGQGTPEQSEAAVQARQRLEAAGQDVEYLFAQRLIVMERRTKEKTGITGNHLDQQVLMDGYALPLVVQDGLVTEFLLVPWVGACIHTPPPPANQIVHVDIPDGIVIDHRFDAVRIAGRLVHDPSEHDLFMIDGSRQIPTSYTLVGATVSGTPGEVVAASASEAGMSVFDRTQIWITEVFTTSMSGMGQRGTLGASALAVLIAFLYGAIHTLGPGHGKAVVISYFVGAGGSLGRGLRMGVQIAITHVLSAVAVVFLLDLAVRQTTGAAPSDYRLIRLFSYGAIIVIGAVMMWQAIGALRAHRAGAGHEHAHNHSHDSHSGCAACAASARQGGWVAAAVGVVPCTGALIVMLFGLANDLVWPAIVMVIAISGGMAVAMSAIGIAAIWGRNLVSARVAGDGARVARFELGAKLAGAASVLLIGTTLFAVTLAHGGIAISASGQAGISVPDDQVARR